MHSDLFKDFDKEFEASRKRFKIFFGIVVVGIFLSWAAYVYVGYQALQAAKKIDADPGKAMQSLGKLFGQFQKGVEEGKK